MKFGLKHWLQTGSTHYLNVSFWSRGHVDKLNHCVCEFQNWKSGLECSKPKSHFWTKVPSFARCIAQLAASVFECWRELTSDWSLVSSLASLRSQYEMHILLELCSVQIATVSRDGHAYIWNAADGSKLHELVWKAVTQHRFRNCRWVSLCPLLTDLFDESGFENVSAFAFVTCFVVVNLLNTLFLEKFL